TETQVAAGIEYATNAVDFEVYALTHPDLAVDHRFKADGNTADLTVDVTVNAAAANRFALSYNGQNGNGNAFPRPMFSARYLNDTSVRLERRRWGQNFPAWVQGIDFSAVRQVTVNPGNDPANLVVPADGYTLEPGVTMTVTFQVQVDPDLAPAIIQIVNNAGAATVEQPGPFNASATDDVIRLAVNVEPNNAGFAVAGDTVTYTHEVVNTGDETDSYNLTVQSELGWTIELIDPGTGVVLATDTDGDGVWDGGVTINTGSLDPGESESYRVRVNVPPGTPVGTEESTTLDAVSDRYAAVSSFATDETTVLDSIDLGPVMLLPDYSGVVTAGGSIAYTHSITNNTGATDTFDLVAVPDDATWTATIYNDSNGDGVYTPGIDVEIANTLQLADGELQTFFVVVDAPVGALPGDYAVAHLTATSRNDPDLWDGATDTTTITPATGHDLSGGGTQLTAPGLTPVFPGTLKNFGEDPDSFDFLITPSPFFGVDGLNHPTELWIDTGGDGVPDTQIAEDADGDGTWDTIAPGYDTNGNSEPDVSLLAREELAYELRRPVDPAQLAYRDPVTLSAVSFLTGDVDSVTATNLAPALAHAVVAGFAVSWSGENAVVEWRTVSESGTVGFYLERWPAAGGRAERLDGRLLPGLLHAPQGGVYRYVDRTAIPGRSYLYQLFEVDVRGGERRFGPFFATLDPNAVSAVDSIPGGYSREPHRSSLRPPVPATPRPPAVADDESDKVKVTVRESGLVYVEAAALAAAFGEEPEILAGRIRNAGLRVYTEPPGPPEDPCAAGKAATAGEIFSDGFESGDLCAWSSAARGPVPQGLSWLATEGAGLYFYGEAIDSIYTEDNVYWIERLPGMTMTVVDGGEPPPTSGEHFPASRHLEEESYPLTSVIEDPDSDFWFWEFFLAGDATHGSKTFTIDTPGLASAGSAALVVHLQGQTDAEVSPDHHAEVRLNGTLIGDVRWDGSDARQETMSFDPSLLDDGANEVEITALLETGVAFDIFYLDAFDVTYPRFYRAVDDRLEAAAAGHTVMTFEGFSRPDIAVFEISDPQQPRQITARSVEIGGEYRVSFEFHSPTANARFLALPLANAAVAIPEADQASDLMATGNRAEYLVIAAAGLEAAAEELVQHRRDQGFEALMVRLRDVYDEFNHGVASPWAIRDFLDHARTSWELGPRYVVLAGDGSFDYKDRLGTGENLLPVPMHPTPDGLVPSDHRLVDLEGDDGVPEIASGRLPAQTNAELVAYVDKLRAYESAAGAWKSHTLWVADDVDEGGEFVADSDGLLGLLPAGYTSERIYVDELGAAAARQQLLASFEAGALLVTYLGHAGLDRLADEGLLLTGDVAGLGNAERMPIAIALTCTVGRFDLPGYDTLAETLVLHDAGGAVALWSPTGLSLNAEAAILGNEFLGLALGTPSRLLGDAVVEALREYLSASSSPNTDIPYIFTLIGDPALSV
ncbi:MAG: hypothetical protein GY856_51660, partial [bacterium]|nr:hypothetical protein [bacterium]